MLESLQENPKNRSSLVKYHDFRLDEDSGKVILIQEHLKMMDFDYHIKNYGYIEESKIKVVAFQILKAIQNLASIQRNHG
jgi:serine/threonine protein kinase